MVDTTRLAGHREWADPRKKDPRYSMDWRRGTVAALDNKQEEDDVTAADVWNHPITLTMPGKSDPVTFRAEEWLMWANHYAATAPQRVWEHSVTVMDSSGQPYINPAGALLGYANIKAWEAAGQTPPTAEQTAAALAALVGPSVVAAVNAAVADIEAAKPDGLGVTDTDRQAIADRVVAELGRALTPTGG